MRRPGLDWRNPGLPSENTLAAFDYAIANGCDGFEFDVRYARDRRAVLCHDPTFNRRNIEATDYGGLERSGHKLACLEDVLARFAATAYLDIELKVAGNEESVVAALRANPPQRGYVVSSFLPEVLLQLHELEPALPLGYICEHPKDAARWTDLPITASLPNWRLVSQQLVDEVHSQGVKLITWTVNDAGGLLRLASWGVDGLISDSPSLLSKTFPDAPARPSGGQRFRTESEKRTAKEWLLGFCRSVPRHLDCS